jgi:protein-S-isoprenylcysteine O-methyltransferase Ste14
VLIHVAAAPARIYLFHDAQRRRTRNVMGAIMLKLPPPVWTLIFLVVAAALSFALGWPKVPGLPLPPLGIALVVVAFIPPVWAAGLFRREGTEIDPTSPTNRALVTRGPYRVTRNPMYLGLITFALGIAIWVGRLADVSGADRGVRHHALRAHSVRRSEDAPPVRRGLRRLCRAGGSLAVR